MKPSSFRLAKIKWLFAHDECRKNPLRTWWRLLRWELLRLASGKLRYKYDNDFYVTLLPNEGASRLTYYLGVTEPELFRVYNEFLRPGMVVVDAGANIGLHTLFFSKRVCAQGKVYAFEPSKNIYGRLSEHVESNKVKNVECLWCALGAVSGTVDVINNIEDTSRTFVRPCNSAPGNGVSAPMETLDTFTKSRHIPKIDFLKIDVEGFEKEILEGASELLAQNTIKVIQVELDERSLTRAGSNLKQVLHCFSKNNYALAQWSVLQKKFEQVSSLQYNSFFVVEEMLAPPHNCL